MVNQFAFSKEQALQKLTIFVNHGMILPANHNKKIDLEKEDKILVKFKDDLKLDNLIPDVSALVNITHLDMHGVDLTQEQWKEFTQLPQLESLDLSSSTVNDSNIINLKPLLYLRDLNLSSTKISTASLEIISTLTSLLSLDISCTYIQDITCLTSLKKKLKLLDYHDCKVQVNNQAIIQLVEFHDELKKTTLSKEGYLTKRGGRIKTWKKRWMILNKDGHIIYKESPENTLGLGIIDLSEPDVKVGIAEEVTDHPFVFKVVTKLRTFYISAKTKDEMTEWLTALIKMLTFTEFKIIV